MKNKFDIIYEDDLLIAVNKAPGITVIPRRNSNEPSIKDYLQQKFQEVYVVHRIDEGTSGLVVFAKTPEIHKSLNELFSSRKVNKTYLLLTRGIPNESGCIDLPLKKLNNKNKSIVHKDGKEAKSNYKVLSKFGSIAFCESSIETGRHHQLRVHFSAIGCPLLVDPIYGSDSFFLSEIKGKKYKLSKAQEERPLLSRLSLHASKLSFLHPIKKEIIELEAKMPKDLNACLNQLRKVYG